MKKLLSAVLTIIILPGFLQAQEICENPSGNKIPLKCSATGVADVNVTSAVVAPSTAATFAALSNITAATLAAGYATVVDLPDGTKWVQIDNQTNGDVMISMNGGTADTWHVKAGDVQTVALAPLGLVTTAVVQAKDGTTASTAGSLYVSSIK